MIATYTKWIESKFSHFNIFISLYEVYYKRIVVKELKLADIKNSDRILCIGGGSIPCTALALASQTNAKIHVIDMDNDAVKSARHLVKKLGLSNQISITKDKGEEIDISSYNVIHIALQVTPKEEVLKHIWNQSKKGNKILVRLPKKILKPFYSNISKDFTNRYASYIKSCSLRYRINTIDKILLMVKN